MNPIRSVIGAMALAGLACLAAPTAQPEKVEPTATVELMVRGPNGRFLPNAMIQILPTRSYQSSSPSSVETQTNAKGVARFSWPIGVRQVYVVAKGVGHGATGVFEVVEGKTAQLAMPPLLPFGAIEGTVPREVRNPGTYVSLIDRRGHKRRTTCDDQGRFIFKDVVCGSYTLRPYSKEADLGIEAEARVAPGQRVKTMFHKVEVEPEERTPVRQPESPNNTEKTLWKGTVRDESGRAIEGANVYAIYTYHDGLRMLQTVPSTRTDKEGRWVLKELNQWMTSAHLIVHKTGHPAVFTPLLFPPYGLLPAQTKQVDLPSVAVVLPARGGNLDIVVTNKGKPLANATVNLYRSQNAPIRYVSGFGENDELNKIFYPEEKTDVNGVAHFRHLVPGNYDVFTSDATLLTEEYDARKSRRARCLGIPVRAGETRTFRLAIYQQPNEVRVRVLGPNGKPPHKEIALEWEQFRGEVSTNVRTLDPDGLDTLIFNDPGLRSLRYKYRDFKMRSRWMGGTPYYEAAAVVAVSPLLRNAPPTILTAWHRESGVLLVQLQDLSGKPARGFVLIDHYSFGQLKWAGSTDEQGHVRFTGMREGNFRLDASLEGQALPDLGFGDGPLPADKDLVDRSVFSRNEASLSVSEEKRVVIQPQRVGYVRGRVRPSKGRRCADYDIFGGVGDYPQSLPAYRLHYNKKTGEFVLGPLLEGKATVTLYDQRASGKNVSVASKEVEIHGTQVARVDFAPQPAKVHPDTKDQTSSTGRMDREPKVYVRVFLPDGKTPAFAAKVAFGTRSWLLDTEGRTDGAGRAVLRSTWHFPTIDKPRRSAGMAESVVVAWLPGAHGAAIVPLKAPVSEELKIVLPPSIRICGNVTLGGKSIQGWENQFHVFAAYEGKGKLNERRSLHVSAEVDGTFELSGLTPGTYRIQAAMDGIWLSSSKRLTIAAEDAKLGPLTLDIGEPGVSSRLQLVNERGESLRGAQLTLVRPAGPLTERLWPKHFHADGAGVVHLPPLEVGTHRIRVRDEAKEQLLVIPPLSKDQAEPIERRVVVD